MHVCIVCSDTWHTVNLFPVKIVTFEQFLEIKKSLFEEEESLLKAFKMGKS